MSLFGTSGLPGQKRKPLGLQTDRSATNESAQPVPWLFGRRRMSLIFISDCFDIKTVAVSGGGKGAARSGNNYYASFAGLACRGPVTRFHDLYLNQEAVYASLTSVKIIQLSNVGNVATAHTSNAHGLTDGQVIEINGSNQPQFNGEYAVTVINATQFAYTIAGSLSNVTAQGHIYFREKLDPIDAGADDSAEITLPDYGMFTLHWGTETDVPDAYLNAASGIRFPAFRGFSYFVFKQLFLGFNQSSVQNVETVMESTPTLPWLLDPAHANINGEANPACVIGQLLQDFRQGFGMPDFEIDLASLAAAAQTFATESLGVSRVLTDQNDAASLITELCETVGAQPVQDAQGRFALSLLRQPVGGADLPQVGDAQLSDLPEVEPGDWTSTNNLTRVTFDNRDNVYLSDYVEWHDLGAYSVNEQSSPLNLTRPWITLRNLAQDIVSAAGRSAALPAITGRLQLLFDADLYAALVPGAQFQLAWSKRPAAVTYRVSARTIGDPAKPEFEIELEADRSYLNFTGAPSFDLPPPVAPPVEAAAPAPLARVRILELPQQLSGTSQVTVAPLAARDNVTAASALLHVGVNDYAFGGAAPVQSYQPLAAVKQFALHGTLTSPYPAGTEYIDLKLGLQLALDGVDLELDSPTPQEALSNAVLVVVGAEIMALVDAVLIGPGSYRVHVIRARFSTAAAAHAVGDEVFILPLAGLTPVSHPSLQVGNTVDFKVVMDATEIADAGAVAAPIAGVALTLPAPTGLMVNGQFPTAFADLTTDVLNISWATPDVAADFDMDSAYTLLEFLEAGIVVHTLKIAWPGNSQDYTYPTTPASVVLRLSFFATSDWQLLQSPTTEMTITHHTHS
jgi:hypothetical protein